MKEFEFYKTEDSQHTQYNCDESEDCSGSYFKAGDVQKVMWVLASIFYDLHETEIDPFLEAEAIELIKSFPMDTPHG